MSDATTSGAVPAAAPNGPVAPPTYLPIASARSIAGTGVRLDPPPLNSTPQSALGWAFAVCTGTPPAAPCPAGQPKAEYALFSDDVYGNPSSSPYPRYQQVRAWIFTWDNLPCVSAGGIGNTGTPTSYSCQRIIAVDATTGGYLLAFDVGVPKQ